MFLVKQATSVMLLVVAFGILLPEVYIQPAQGLQCYLCEPCIEDDLGRQAECPKTSTKCAIGEREYEDGKRIVFRSCLDGGQAESGVYSCDKFVAFPENPGEKLRVCGCDTEFCNEQEPSNAARNAEASSSTEEHDDDDDESSSSLPKAIPFGFGIVVAFFAYNLGRA